MPVERVWRVLDSGFPVVSGRAGVVAVRDLVTVDGTGVVRGAVGCRRVETAGACATALGEGRVEEDDG